MATGYENRDNQQSTTTQGATGGQAGGDWGSLKEGVGEVADVAMEQGRQFLDSAREQATGFADQRKNDAAEYVDNLANSLRESCSAFEGRAQIRAVVESAASGLEQLADGIRTRNLSDMIGDVEALVRRRPAVAAVATMAAGFLIARFVKASAEELRESGRQSGPAGGSQARGAAGSNTYRRGQAGA